MQELTSENTLLRESLLSFSSSLSQAWAAGGVRQKPGEVLILRLKFGGTWVGDWPDGCRRVINWLGEASSMVSGKGPFVGIFRWWFLRLDADDDFVGAKELFCKDFFSTGMLRLDGKLLRKKGPRCPTWTSFDRLPSEIFWTSAGNGIQAWHDGLNTWWMVVAMALRSRSCLPSDVFSSLQFVIESFTWMSMNMKIQINTFALLALWFDRHHIYNTRSWRILEALNVEISGGQFVSMMLCHECFFHLLFRQSRIGEHFDLHHCQRRVCRAHD